MITLEQFSALIDSIDGFRPVNAWTRYALAYGEDHNIPYDAQGVRECLLSYTGLAVELDSDEQALTIFETIQIEALQDTPATVFWAWVCNELTFEILVARTEDRDEALKMVLNSTGEVTDEVLDTHNRRKNRFIPVPLISHV